MRASGKRVAVAASAAVVSFAAGGRAARAEVSAYGLFGGAGVNLDNSVTVTGGAVGSNAAVTIGTFETLGGLLAGGAVSAGDSDVFNGPVAVGGAFASGSATFAGPVSVGGDATFTSGPTTVAGGRSDLTVGGSLVTSFAKLTGDVRAGQNVTFGNGIDTLTGNLAGNGTVTLNGTVTGRVAYGTALTVGAFGTAGGGTVMATTPVAPVALAPVTLPSIPVPSLPTRATATLTAGGTLAAPLAPGAYGAADIRGGSPLYLTAGDYAFSSLTLESGVSVHLVNLAPASAIRVFVAGDFTQVYAVRTLVDEQSFLGVAADNNLSNLATNVLFEVGGNYAEGPTFGSNQIFGTLLLPTGNATFRSNTSVTGAVLAGGTVTSGVALAVKNVPNAAVPEPAGVGAAAAAAVAVCRRRWRRPARIG